MRETGIEPPFGDPGITIRACRDPETEATKLEGPRVAVIRSAREGRQLLERLGGPGTTSRLPRNRALDRSRGVQVATAGPPAPDEPAGPPRTEDEAAEAPGAAPGTGPGKPGARAPGGARPSSRPKPAARARPSARALSPTGRTGEAAGNGRGRDGVDLDGVEARLRVAAAATNHWALQADRRDADHLTSVAGTLGRAAVVAAAIAAVGAVVAVLAPGPLPAAAVTLATAAAVLLALRLRAARAGAASAAAAAEAIELGLLADHDLAPSVRAELLPWPAMLARYGLPPLHPDQVEEAVDELRRRGGPSTPVRTSPDADALDDLSDLADLDDDAGGPQPTSGDLGDDSLAALDALDGDGEPDGTGRPAVVEPLAPLPRPAPPAGGSQAGVDLVVVVDDGLYVGHRLALRDVSEKLAARVPLLVLATNERLWQSGGRTR